MDYHRDESDHYFKESANSRVHAATFVKMSGDAWHHTNEWQLLGLNMGLNTNFYSLFLLYSVLY